MFQGIRGRIVSTYLILILISMAVLGITLIWLLQNYFLSNLKENMVNQAGLVSALVEEQISAGDINKIDPEVKFLGKKLHVRITVILPDGRIAGDSEINPGTWKIMPKGRKLLRRCRGK